MALWRPWHLSSDGVSESVTPIATTAISGATAGSGSTDGCEPFLGSTPGESFMNHEDRTNSYVVTRTNGGPIEILRRKMPTHDFQDMGEGLPQVEVNEVGSKQLLPETELQKQSQKIRTKNDAQNYVRSKKISKKSKGRIEYFTDMGKGLPQVKANEVGSKLLLPEMQKRSQKIRKETQRVVQDFESKKIDLKREIKRVTVPPVSAATPLEAFAQSAKAYLCVVQPNPLGHMFSPGIELVPLVRAQPILHDGNRHLPIMSFSLPPNLNIERNPHPFLIESPLSPPMIVNPFPTPAQSPSSSPAPAVEMIKRPLLEKITSSSLDPVCAYVPEKEKHPLKTVKKQSNPRKDQTHCNTIPLYTQSKISKVANGGPNHCIIPMACEKINEKKKSKEETGKGFFQEKARNENPKRRRQDVTAQQDPSMFFSTDHSYSQSPVFSRNAVQEERKPSFNHSTNTPLRVDPRPDNETEDEKEFAAFLESIWALSDNHSDEDEQRNSKNRNLNEDVHVNEVGCSENSIFSLDDDGWIEDLFSTQLAKDVLDEALNDSFCPDISTIQDFLTGEVDDVEDYLSNKSCAKPFAATLPHEEPNLVVKDEESRLLKFSDALRQFSYHEELYKNDILILHAEDEAMPLPF